MPTTLEILDRLIAFETVPRNSNRALVDYVKGLLEAAGIGCELVPEPGGDKLALLASLPASDGGLAGGIALAAHMDVVAADGQAWTRPAFQLTRGSGKLYGRGTTDMKGFLAAALDAFIAARVEPLARPLHLALSYDEEIGCKGVRPLIECMKAAGRLPDCAIIGEPTLMTPVVEHKGKIALACEVRGESGHSSYAAGKVNAVVEAARLIVHIASLAEAIPAREAPDPAYTAPHSSLHVGPIRGGEALNIIPQRCRFEFECRFRPDFAGQALMDEVKAHAHAMIGPEMQRRNPATGFTWSVLIDYPAFRTTADSAPVQLAARLSGSNALGKVDYGTEAGVYAEYGIDSVVIGPGSMAQGHQPDEFIADSELARAEAFLARVVESLRE